jgi:hypothetical protein
VKCGDGSGRCPAYPFVIQWGDGAGLVGSLMGHMGQRDRPVPGSLPKGNGNPIIALLGQSGQ